MRMDHVGQWFEVQTNWVGLWGTLKFPLNSFIRTLYTFDFQRGLEANQAKKT